MKRKTLRHGLSALCILAAGAAASGIAAAGESDRATNVRSAVVRYDDLNLASEQGSKQAYARLQIAASAVCGTVDFRNDVAAGAWRTCYKTALDHAVAALDSDRVTALHAHGARRRSGD